MPSFMSKARAIVAAAAAGITTFAIAGPEYTFTLVDAFTPNYDLRECYIYDISDQNVACGTGDDPDRAVDHVLRLLLDAAQ